ncbi:major facilitator superfamily domain-containing protein [Fusarium acuminatum]|uniref:Major facilitator superfamily domain-containing protein n=1 Tax=Fusarium acuminatum TaxID=5515 RepID=A0ABZ2WL96_9HYPO
MAMENQPKLLDSTFVPADADIEIHGTERDESPTEESPLLRNDTPSADEPSKAFRRRALGMCMLALLMVEVSQFIMNPPTKKIIEDIICRQHYPDHDIRVYWLEDSRCKDSPVQKTLAMVQGWSQAFEMGVLLFPDIFSIWAILGDSIFFLIGGGGQMAVAMVYTIVADVVPVEERTDMFFRLVALVLVFNVVFNPISAWLLQYDPWLSMWIGFGFMVFGTLCILLIPETMHLRRKGDMQHNAEHENEQINDVSPSKHHVLKQAWFSIKNDMQHVWRFIFASRSIMILMFATAFFFPSRIVLTGILLQYMSKRFEWSWSKATYVSTIGIIATVVCYLVILPVTSDFLNKSRRYKSHPIARDLLLSRIAIVTMAVGCLLMGLAGTPWLFVISLITVSLGNSFVALSRALINALVEPHTIATLNTTVSLIEVTMGLSAPAMGWLLARGMELGGGWMGLPFLVNSGFAALTAVMLFIVRIPHGVAQAHEG